MTAAYDRHASPNAATHPALLADRQPPVDNELHRKHQKRRDRRPLQQKPDHDGDEPDELRVARPGVAYGAGRRELRAAPAAFNTFQDRATSRNPNPIAT